MSKQTALIEIYEKLRYDKEVSTKKEFAERIGVDKTNLSSAFNGVEKYLTDNLFSKIACAFPEYREFISISIGETEIMQNSKDAGRASIESKQEAQLVPLLPIAAQGGNLNDFVVSVKEGSCEYIVSPIKEADFAMTINGDSMAPEYPNGSKIYIKRINEKAFIEWGKAYVLDTCNGSVVKCVIPSDREGYLKCISINPDPKYAPFEVALSDIFGMYRVLLCMSIK